jgi:hypothetical protein
MVIPDPGSKFFTPDLGSEFFFPDPGSASKILGIVTQKIVSKISET